MRTIEVAAVQLWSDTTRSPDDNREHAYEMAAQAAKKHPDLIVLPESISMLCYPDGRPDFTYHDVSESVPGPSTERLAEIARTYKTNVVVGLIADRGPDIPCQNVAVVIDRTGTIVGIYEKLHEPAVCRTRQAAAVGNSLPIFDLDFGRIGIMICWDLIAPEVALVLAHKGAELICFPHMIGLPSPANFNIQVRARAIDTGVPVVAAGMRDEHNHNGSDDDLFPTCILDAGGKVVKQTDTAGPDVVTAQLTLGGKSANEQHVKRSRSDLRFDVYASEYAKLARHR